MKASLCNPEPSQLKLFLGVKEILQKSVCKETLGVVFNLRYLVLGYF